MNRHVIAVALILLLGGAAFGGWKWWSDRASIHDQVKASVSTVERTVRIAKDGYKGYFFAESPVMKQQLAKRGLAVEFTDEPDYESRLAGFARGDFNAVAITVGGYLEYGIKVAPDGKEVFKYPGVVTESIAESKGADSILCFADKIPTGTIKDLNDASLKIVYTGKSPSEFLIFLAIVDFDLYNLKRSNTWKVEVASSEEAFEKARKREGDCFVMWEPEVSKALREIPQLKKVFGSDEFAGYIDDVFVFDRNFVAKNHEDVVNFFEAYFETMRVYASDRDRFMQDMKSSSPGLTKDDIDAIVKNIDWHDLNENATRWFGLDVGVGVPSREGLVSTINAVVNVLVQTGKFERDPLKGDPWSIINKSVLETVYKRLPAQLGRSGAKREFRQLNEAEWNGLQHVGLMRVEAIKFVPGTSDLDTVGKEKVDQICELLTTNYPDARVVVRGHTDKGMDEQESIRLSSERAETVVQRLKAVCGESEYRFRIEGKGSSEPPVKKPDENMRLFKTRIPRVEFDLFLENEF